MGLLNRDDLIRAAERTADSFFDAVLELTQWSIERRRTLACWRAVKWKVLIQLNDEDRRARGKRPRLQLINRRRLRIAKAECRANCAEHPEFLAAHRFVEQEEGRA